MNSKPLWIGLGILGLTLGLGFLLWPQPAPPSLAEVDFVAAMRDLNFDPDGDFNGLEGENGIPEGAEMALLNAILHQPELDLSASGGISHTELRQAYEQAYASAQADTKALSIMWPSAPLAIAGYTLLGKDSQAAIAKMAAGFGAVLDGDYSLALSLDPYLSAAGDADGDGFSNRQEFFASGQTGTGPYLQAALDPQTQPTEEQIAAMPELEQSRFTVGIVLYPGFETLDVYGPLNLWSYVPGFEVLLIAAEAGPVLSAQRTQTIATHSFAQAPALDVLMVPGGTGTLQMLKDPELLEFLQKANTQTRFTTAVCTGSALLAKAGVLDGHQATSNKRFFSLAEAQGPNVEWVAEARWVRSGKMLTSSGVTAGMDMALGLVEIIHGQMAALELASSLEYVWNQDAASDPFVEYVDRLVVAEGDEDQLLKSSPKAGAELTRPPEWLRLYFNKRPQLARSQLQLLALDEPERKLSLSGLHEMGANDLMFKVDEALPDGAYRLQWEVTLGESNHPIRGRLDFRVLSP